MLKNELSKWNAKKEEQRALSSGCHGLKNIKERQLSFSKSALAKPKI